MNDRATRARAALRGGLLFAVLLRLCAPGAAQVFRQGAVELVYGQYRLNEPRFEAVYPAGGTVQGISVSAALPYGTNLYFEARHFSRSGALTYSGAKTSVHMLPLSLGVRYVHPVRFVFPYAGAGGDVYMVFENNPIGTFADTAAGVHMQFGAYIGLPETVPILINLRVKRTWVAAKEQGLTLQLGGLEYSAGLVFAF